MKRIFSFLLVVVMLLSMVPTALATTNYTNGTKVEYVGQGAAEYTVTVPALLTPGSNGEVKLSGTWASDCVINVTADKTVTLTSNINAADQKVLDITFAGISKSGDNTAIVEATETVSVSDIENALFGTWSGKFNYNVEYVEPFEFTWTDAIQGTKTYKAKPGMTWGQWVASNYNVDGTDAWYVMNEGMSARISAYNMICTTAEGTAVLSTDAIIPGHAYGSIAK